MGIQRKSSFLRKVGRRAFAQRRKTLGEKGLILPDGTEVTT